MSKHRLHAPLSWPGAKSRLAETIVDLFPEHRLYCETCGGMASVLMAKKPSPIEVYNDLDGAAVRFFRTLREQSMRDSLILQLAMTPYSREEYSMSLDLSEITDDVEFSRRFAIAHMMSMGAMPKGIGNWVSSRKHERQGLADRIAAWWGCIMRLSAVAARMSSVQIEQRDAVKIIKRYDAVDTLFYVDPPYVMGARSAQTGAQYRCEMTDEQHTLLAQTLKTISGKAILSGYHNPIYERILGKWHTVEIEHFASFDRGIKKKRTEVLWMNFTPRQVGVKAAA